MRRLVYILALMSVLAVMPACKKTPSYVIAPDDMADLLADLYVADGVVDQNHMEYRTDSAKLILRQSILARHNVSQEDFDTSLVWYGHNMDKYIDVYDKAIDILKDRELKLGAAIVQSSVNISGDSVDVWPASHYARLNSRFPSKFIAFEVPSDDNWEPGDVYIWRLKTIDEVHSLRWNVYANYADSTNEWLSYNSSNDGWNEVVFPTDSTRTLTGLRGYVEVVLADPYDTGGRKGDKAVKAERDVWIDSISLVRKRVNEELYYNRHRLRQANDL